MDISKNSNFSRYIAENDDYGHISPLINNIQNCEDGSGSDEDNTYIKKDGRFDMSKWEKTSIDSDF